MDTGFLLASTRTRSSSQCRPSIYAGWSLRRGSRSIADLSLWTSLVGGVRLFDEMVMQIINLKAEIDRLRKQLEEAERRYHSADLEVGSADAEFVQGAQQRHQVGLTTFVIVADPMLCWRRR